MKKSIFTHLIALAIGAAAGYFFTEKKLRDEYEALAQEEIDSVKHIFGKYYGDCDADDNREDGIGPGMESDFEEECRNTPYSAVARSSLDTTGVKSERAKKQYNLAFDKDAVQEEQDLDEEVAEDIDRSVPYLISDAEYSEECQSFEKISLYYYLHDDVLCDENEKPMDDIDGTVGRDWQNDLSSVNPCVWVRNEPLEIDYEICAVNASYAQNYGIRGVVSENENLSPRERYMRNQNRRNEDEE